MMRTRTSWELNDIWAVMIGAARAATVVYGMLQLREGGVVEGVFLTCLAVAFAGVLFDLVHKLSRRWRNPLDPEQSLLTLLPAWLLMLSLVVGFGALAAFATISEDVAHRDSRRAFAAHWTGERHQLETWRGEIRSALQRRLREGEAEAAAEQARVTAARRRRQPYSTATLNERNRELAAVRAAVRRASDLGVLPLTPPEDQRQAFAAFNDAFAAAGDLVVAATPILSTLPPTPIPRPFSDVETDLRSVFVRATLNREPTAMLGFAMAMLLELTGLVAVHRGGRRASWPAIIQARRRGCSDVWRALWSRAQLIEMPVVIVMDAGEIEGRLYLRQRANFTLSDCRGRVEDTVSDLVPSRRCRIAAITTGDGRAIDEGRPLRRQLAEGDDRLRVVVREESSDDE
jgi:hypothetical protein